MADKNKNANSKKIQNSLDTLSNQINDLYNTTYFTNDNTEEIKTQVNDRLDDAIRRATQGDDEYKSISSTSKLFRKLLKNDNSLTASNKISKNFGTGNENDISTLFQSNELTASLMDQYSKMKWVTELDNEFRLICKYMPKLQIALDIKRDAILCSDSYSKEFLTIRTVGENGDIDRNTAIQNNIKEMTNKYSLHDKVERWCEDANKYGEVFIYCVPYSDALTQLLNKKKNSTQVMMNEATITIKDIKSNLIESGVNPDTIKMNNIKIHFDHSKILSEAVEHNLFLQKAVGRDDLRGLSESYMLRETNDSFSDHVKKEGRDKTVVKFDTTITNELEWEDDKTAKDGLVNSKETKINKLKVNGAVLKVLARDKTIPIYIEDAFFGAYYIEIAKYEDLDINSVGNFTGYNGMTSMFNNSVVSAAETNAVANENNKNILLRTLAAKLSQKIDAEFINANIDLTKEIYQILSFNNKYNTIETNNALNNMDMNIVFIPADDIYHLKFKEDPVTHRGISDLWNSLVPAKQWITLNLTSILGWTTRGFDRRLYYVKQSLDTNTAQSLLNVISTIKKGNFGIRQMESVNNVLNIVGRFNDFVVPMGPSGEAPILFDTQPGQQFDFPEQLMQNVEESAVNPILPLEIVNSSTGMDFAVRYTMTNAKLLRDVLKRQLKMELCCNDVFTKLYRFEYNDNQTIDVTLPIPAFLGMTQGSQLLNTANQYADAITEVEMAGKSDEAKAIFKRRVIRRYISSYLTDEDIQNIKDNVSMDILIDKSKQEDEI